MNGGNASRFQHLLEGSELGVRNEGNGSVSLEIRPPNHRDRDPFDYTRLTVIAASMRTQQALWNLSSN